MKSFNLTIILITFFSIANAQSDTASFRQAAVAIQKKFAPDKRSVYFNLRIKDDSVSLETTSAQVLQEFEKITPQAQGLKFTSTLLPAKSLNGFDFGVANISVANNRAYPGHSAELMTQMLLGTPIRIYKKQGGFYLVQTPDGYLAWVDAGAIKPMDEGQFKKWQLAEKVVFTSDYGHSYVNSKISGLRVSDLVSGNILEVLAHDKLVTKVAYPDGRVAFLETKQVTKYKDWIARANPNAKQIISTAETLIGVPYLWGGTSTKGVDCSGFTKTAYFLNGVVIPRDASQQALVGDFVEVLENDSISVEKCLKNLQAGDLMFFAASKRRGINGGRVTHTAIYMGEGQFIQSAGMVKVSSIIPSATNYDGGQSSTLVGARRILTEIGKPEITRVAAHTWYGIN